MITTFLLLLVAHALCDYPLQGDFLSRSKNPASPVPGVPWMWAMAAHAAIHGGAVGLVTQIQTLGLCEFAAHAVIDYAKCRGWLTFSGDQWLHIVCKALWAGVKP